MKKIISTTILFLCFWSFSKTEAQSTTPNGIYNLWYEYGNSQFYKTSFSTLDSLLNFQNVGLPPNGTNELGIKKIITTYNPTPPPANTIKFYSARPTQSINNSYPKISLLNGNDLGIVKSTTDFISNDTIMIALQYTATTNIPKKVAFFYNNNSTSSFLQIPASNNIITLPNDFTANNTYPTKQIRVHKSESIAIATASQLANAGAGYNNGLVFSLPNTRPLTSNIFLTMYSFLDIPSANIENFKIIFLDNADKPISKGYQDNIVNHSKLKSHDPNNELVSVGCLTPTEAINKILDYTVNFQNTGLGNADTIITKTTLPIGYSINDVIGYPNITTPWQIADTFFNDNYVVQNTYSHDNIIEMRYYKKPSRSMILRGTLGLIDPSNDARTKGGFHFSLQLKPPYTAPQSLISSTAIYFDKNDAVITNDAIVTIKECCQCPDSNYSNNNTKENIPEKCLCKKRKSKFFTWLFCKDC
jgi:hypothetical protein